MIVSSHGFYQLCSESAFELGWCEKDERNSPVLQWQCLLDNPIYQKINKKFCHFELNKDCNPL